MGTLRTLFAITVVLGHTGNYVFIGGRNAVQLFYVISGFLISYVLVERRAYATTSSFYINRYLRLYPIYLVVALLSFVFIAATGKDVRFFEIYDEAPVLAKVLLIFSNATMFLQDWVMFSGVQNNELVFVINYRESDIGLWKALLVPQAWTLGVELTFYLVAPFILGRSKIVFLLVLISIVTRIYLIQIGLGTKDPWTYRFFPTELALFLLGALAHQMLLPRYKKYLSERRLGVIASSTTCFLILVTLTYWLVPMSNIIKTVFFFSLFFLFMPLAFQFQSEHNWDKWVGDLSYPIYICHILVIEVLKLVSEKIGITDNTIVAISAVIASVAVAIVLNYVIGKPVELFRNQFRKDSVAH